MSLFAASFRRRSGGAMLERTRSQGGSRCRLEGSRDEPHTDRQTNGHASTCICLVPSRHCIGWIISESKSVTCIVGLSFENPSSSNSSIYLFSANPLIGLYRGEQCVTIYHRSRKSLLSYGFTTDTRKAAWVQIRSWPGRTWTILFIYLSHYTHWLLMFRFVKMVVPKSTG